MAIFSVADSYNTDINDSPCLEKNDRYAHSLYTLSKNRLAARISRHKNHWPVLSDQACLSRYCEYARSHTSSVLPAAKYFRRPATAYCAPYATVFSLAIKIIENRKSYS